MILTGEEIARAQAAGELSLCPFSADELNPNSYNFRLGKELICIGPRSQSETPIRRQIPKEGCLLTPGTLYLGATHERIASRQYVITLLGRSSTGRLGIYLNATADLGHTGSDANWTLEISVVKPVRVYALMRIGQVAFWSVEGAAQQYDGRYHEDFRPELCKDLNLTNPYLRDADIDSHR